MITEREKQCVKIGVDATFKSQEKKCENCKYFEWCEEDEDERKQANKEWYDFFKKDKDSNMPLDTFKDLLFIISKGNCRRYPPSRNDEFVNNLDWCGEFKAKV